MHAFPVGNEGMRHSTGPVDDAINDAFWGCAIFVVFAAVFAVMAAAIVAVWAGVQWCWTYFTTTKTERAEAKVKTDRRAEAIRLGTWVGK